MMDFVSQFLRHKSQSKHLETSKCTGDRALSSSVTGRNLSKKVRTGLEDLRRFMSKPESSFFSAFSATARMLLIFVSYVNV